MSVLSSLLLALLGFLAVTMGVECPFRPSDEVRRALTLGWRHNWTSEEHEWRGLSPDVMTWRLYRTLTGDRPMADCLEDDLYDAWVVFAPSTCPPWEHLSLEQRIDLVGEGFGRGMEATLRHRSGLSCPVFTQPGEYFLGLLYDLGEIEEGREWRVLLRQRGEPFHPLFLAAEMFARSALERSWVSGLSHPERVSFRARRERECIQEILSAQRSGRSRSLWSRPSQELWHHWEVVARVDRRRLRGLSWTARGVFFNSSRMWYTPRLFRRLLNTWLHVRARQRVRGQVREPRLPVGSESSQDLAVACMISEGSPQVSPSPEEPEGRASPEPVRVQTAVKSGAPSRRPPHLASPQPSGPVPETGARPQEPAEVPEEQEASPIKVNAPPTGSPQAPDVSEALGSPQEHGAEEEQRPQEPVGPAGSLEVAPEMSALAPEEAGRAEEGSGPQAAATDESPAEVVPVAEEVEPAIQASASAAPSEDIPRYPSGDAGASTAVPTSRLGASSRRRSGRLGGAGLPPAAKASSSRDKPTGTPGRVFWVARSRKLPNETEQPGVG